MLLLGYQQIATRFIDGDDWRCFPHLLLFFATILWEIDWKIVGYIPNPNSIIGLNSPLLLTFVGGDYLYGVYMYIHICVSTIHRSEICLQYVTGSSCLDLMGDMDVHVPKRWDHWSIRFTAFYWF